MKSVYVGRGEIAHLIANFESHSTKLEKLMRAKKSINAGQLEKVESAVDRAVELESTLYASSPIDCWLSYSQEAMETETEWPWMLKW